MNHYGLHFTSSDRDPVQVRIDTKDGSLAVYARYAKTGGAFTAWRRLDVTYLADGKTIDGKVSEAAHAASADTAKSATSAGRADIADLADRATTVVGIVDAAKTAQRLATPISLEFTGDVTGSVNTDFGDNVTVKLTLSKEFKDLIAKVNTLETRMNYINNRITYYDNRDNNQYDYGGGG